MPVPEMVVTMEGGEMTRVTIAVSTTWSVRNSNISKERPFVQIVVAVVMLEEKSRT